MFGHDDSQQQPSQDNIAQASMPDPIPVNSFSTPAVPNPDPASASIFGSPPPAAVIPSTPNFSVPEITAASTPDTPSTSNDPAPDTASQATDDNNASDSGSTDLLGLKQQALQHLSPLVDHLDQTPEEKFRTTMMMIQASDDQSLIKTAFEAAQAITDDKSRAQALLDVINEINYFTQQTS